MTAQGSGPAVDVHVGLGQIRLARGGSLSIHGLGSCVAVAFWSREPRVAVMCHVLLPASSQDVRGGDPGRSADLALPHGLDLIRAQGAAPAQVTVKLAGGAVLFAGAGGALAVGPRNVAACLEALQALGLRPAASDLGGRLGRSVTLDVATGALTVRRFGAEAVTL